MNNDNVAHAWANQIKTKGKTSNGNMWFDGRSLYSYRTEIARFIDGHPVATAQSYSPTTEGKHKNAMKKATSHLTVYYVDCEIGSIPRNASFQEVAPQILDHLKKGLLQAIEKTKRSKSFAYDCTYIAGQAEKIRDLCRITDLGSGLPIDGLIHATEKTLAEHFSIDIDKRKDAETKHNQATAAKRAAQQAEWAAIRAQSALKATEKLEKWLAGETVYGSIHELPVALRMKGENIETSHGAVITVSTAQELWALIESGASIEGRTIGSYVGRSYDSEKLIIGCHEIPMQEVKKIARLLGLESKAA